MNDQATVLLGCSSNYLAMSLARHWGGEGAGSEIILCQRLRTTDTGDPTYLVAYADATGTLVISLWRLCGGDTWEWITDADMAVLV